MPVLHQLAVIQINVDPALHIGPFSVHWYGVMYAVAFWAGWKFAVTPFLTARGFTRGEIDRMITWVIVFGLLGGRLYYVLQSDLLWYLTHPQHILAVWEGGMAFFGAIISGLGTCYVLARRKGYPFWPVFDAAVLFAVVGQPIGRIGNVINGDILGYQSNLPWATQYLNPNAVLQAGYDHFHAYQPAAVYEALGTILIGVVLYALLRRRVPSGVLAIAYVSLYAVSQLGIFFLRGSEPTIFLGLKQGQWTAIGMLLIGVPAMIWIWSRTRDSGRIEPKPAEAVAVGEATA
ncbi:MAG TPA: prolipoprotein diacylglyceryl transferase [Candidatus Dormibacteraeota bacterium]|nr:prolipoprotein diacylglyceryl transferase [Candidatus Dormibacteraeota bacterium]